MASDGDSFTIARYHLYSGICMATLKTIIEIIKLAMEAWQWISGEIDDLKFRRAINRRSKLRDAYIAGDEMAKLEALRDLTKK